MQQKKQLFRDSIILLLGIIGVAWFVYSFSARHPFGVVEMDMSKSNISSKADSVFQSWQFDSMEFEASPDFTTNLLFVDSLQLKWGTKEFKERYSQSDFLQQLPLFGWTIARGGIPNSESGREVSIHFDTKGNVAEISLSLDYINEHRPFNRYGIRSVFQGQVENYSRSLEDSLIAGLTDYQHLAPGAQGSEQEEEILSQLRMLRGEEDARYYTMDNIWSLSEFYINRTVWGDFDLQQDSVRIMDESGVRFARTFWSTENQAEQVTVQLTVEVLPAGSIKSINYQLNPQREVQNPSYLSVIESISLFLIVVFSIWLLFVFYLRIKARAIDTKPAMVIAVLAGFIVPGFIALQLINDMGFSFIISNSGQLVNGAMLLAVLGAVSAVGFFVLTAVSDSVTRQYWPEKLKSWDLVRRGLFMNKPVGWGIIQAFAIGGILAGAVGLALFLYPGAFISAGSGLASDNFYLASIANLMVNLMMTMIVIIPIFLILGNQVKGVVKREWCIPILGAIMFGLLDVLPFSIEPDLADRIMRVGIGFLTGYFYMRFDTMTIVFGFFIFLNLLSTAKGWLFAGSPDLNAFLMFSMVVVSGIGLGLYFISKGSERKELPEYVPEYIEDQAKEQRLKQELSIARVIQQTFLPSQFHQLPGIDIAGICIPAQETGGDYYDMISLGEQRTAIAIGDVSGKGIRASFYMTFTKGVLHSLSPLILSPVEMLNQLNRLFNENATRGTFISMIYGVLEADKRQFTFARAGHNPMLVVRSNGDVEWLKPDGVGIGVAKGDNFIRLTKEATLNLHEGDVVILYTDGITEMLNTGDRFYDEERLEHLVKGVRKASSQKILEIIVDDVNEFKGMAKQHDDMTLVIIKADASVNQ